MLESGQRAKRKWQEETENYAMKHDAHRKLGSETNWGPQEGERRKGPREPVSVCLVSLAQPLLYGRHSHPTIVFNRTSYPQFY